MHQLKHIKAVIFDWAGTIIDYGCMAPAQVFIEVFRANDICLSMDEARGPMGLAKKDHVRELFRLDTIQKQWISEYGRIPSEDDINVIYEYLEPALAALVADYCEPIPGSIVLINSLKAQGIKVGSTTGYVAGMMKNILPVTSAAGLGPDSVVNSSEVPAGRPLPWMIYRNCEKMNVFPLSQVVKIGDTVADIQEGINAGTWTIGLTKSGNEIGLSQAEAENADFVWLEEKIALAGRKLLNAGADYVAEGVWDCWPILEEIDERIEAGFKK
ncbi:MAG: phosphonoacetaldehyde hydrolase [Bacteroidota bacterium]|nr:phosphonoacetaldehyde hydrolase [Odoribacter sp.]MDP3643468.1 phosphonoacetaldehyde hydrolase [Bacteroidota bacterium]